MVYFAQSLKIKSMNRLIMKKMVRKKITLFIGALLLLGIGSSCSPGDQKVFTPGEVWQDEQGVAINAHGGGILLVGDTYYWFGEHKEAGKEGLARRGVHCYSSKNLYDWKDEGIALAVSEEPGSPIEKGCILERPKVIYNA